MIFVLGFDRLCTGEVDWLRAWVMESTERSRAAGMIFRGRPRFRGGLDGCAVCDCGWDGVGVAVPEEAPMTAKCSPAFAQTDIISSTFLDFLWLDGWVASEASLLASMLGGIATLILSEGSDGPGADFFGGLDVGVKVGVEGDVAASY